MLYSAVDRRVSMGHAAIALRGAMRNTLRKRDELALSSPQIPHGMTHLALHLNELLVETVAAG